MLCRNPQSFFLTAPIPALYVKHGQVFPASASEDQLSESLQSIAFFNNMINAAEGSENTAAIIGVLVLIFVAAVSSILGGARGWPGPGGSGGRRGVTTGGSIVDGGDGAVLHGVCLPRKDQRRLVTVVWNKNIINQSFTISIDRLKAAAAGGSCSGDDGPPTHKVELKPWPFWSKKGLKTLDVNGDRLDIFWDLRPLVPSASEARLPVCHLDGAERGGGVCPGRGRQWRAARSGEVANG
ncbi:hypothetical protein GUJ93_ZPchr0003g18026 [Zizania palustris]|uniref:Uncharacterized protein n=1 Tax=Zizania palustris TaxID=103762 RepID=A0A8J5VWZ3_ZIZPA|nr:hypothetical protein GUJ93_ZPchr0003g18026 [Zizania palustris]